MQKCSNPSDLQGLSQALEDENKIMYWDEISHEIDELCLKISCCSNRCNNMTCRNLQDSQEIELALAEERADYLIQDTLPDNEFY